MFYIRLLEKLMARNEKLSAACRMMAGWLNAEAGMIEIQSRSKEAQDYREMATKLLAILDEPEGG